jgi:UDP:flavonoid glycosyltransferase YjiC (YdhE family)
LWISHFPGIECLRGADVVVGGAGYNTVYECAALGIPLLAFALKRLYDRQERRIKATSYGIKDIEILIATIQSLLNQQQQGIDRHQVNYINGAVEAVGLIEQAIAKNNASIEPI